MPRSIFLLNTRSLILVALLSACALSSLSAQTGTNYIWDPNGNRSDAAGSGSWNTTSVVWDNGSADVPWPNSVGYNPIFNGVDGAYTVTVANGITANAAVFNASGYTLQGVSAASPGTLRLGNGGSLPALNIASGKTVTFGPNLTVNLFGSINQSTAYNGILAVVGSTVNTTTGSYLWGGSINVGAGGSFIGYGMQYGTNSSSPVRPVAIKVNGANAYFTARGSNFYNATVTINNGTAELDGGGPGNGFYNSTIQLNTGGTLVYSAATYNSVINLNGGTLKLDVNGYTSFPANVGLTLAVQTGGAQISAALGSPGVSTIPVPLTHDTSGPAIDGGLTKLGSGVLRLAAPSTYTGGTTVAEGTLLVNANDGLGTGKVSVLSSSICLTIGTGVTNLFSGTPAGLSLAGGGTLGTADVGYLDLSSGANITVSSLVLGTMTYTSGVFTSANAPEYILGTGSVTIVPEPGTVALLLVAGAGLTILARHRNAPR